MKTVIIIPARYASTRYLGKPLVELTLPDGARKSLIQLSWEAACRVNGVDAVYVATDDARIRDAAEAFGADVIMTSETCRNGTERCAEALERGDWDEYFKTVPVDIPAHLQSSYAETNDPLAIAAITRAELLRHRTFLVPPVPTLAYWAEGDSFAGQNSRLSESMPIESAVIPGGHADAFLNVERVAAEVDPFLSAHFTQGR